MPSDSKRATSEIDDRSLLYRPSAPIENLKRRGALYRALRAFFDQRDFCEVATPTLSRDVIVDRYVEPIVVRPTKCWQEPDRFVESRFLEPERSREFENTFYLQTSPEFAMKRLLIAGMDAIYQITPAFRSGDRGDLHNVEFTMLEWYRRDLDYEQGRKLLRDLVENVAKAFYEQTRTDPQKWATSRVKERPFADAFREFTNLDPIAEDSERLKDYAVAEKIPCPESYLAPQNPADKDDWIDLIFSEKVQPRLGFDSPVLLYDYPATQSQLAKTARVGQFDVARRYELFVNGVELANGYDELLDPDVLEERTRLIARRRDLDRSTPLPVRSRLMVAMLRGMPQAAGCALGVDRFLCVLLGLDQIDQVLAFPIEIA